MIGSYTKLYNLGDRRLLDLFQDPLVVQEKIDGSQFSFMLDDAGQLCADEIKDLLFKWAWKKMARGTTAGLPEWYKERLMKEGFGE